MLLVLTSILAIYLITMAWVFIGIKRLPKFLNRKSPNSITFSIVIPFRNEEENLQSLVESLLALRYNYFDLELLFINDASDDHSVGIIENVLKDTTIPYRILNNMRFSASPKKDAITLAVKEAKHKWIVTTDADCRVPPYWLELMSNHIVQKNSKMLCGPVLFHTDDSLLQQFQFWDGLSLQAATQAGFGWNSPLLCNGANLAFERDVFFEVNGFEGNNHLATGDDIFLMEKLKRYYPGQVHYLNNSEATVVTQPTDSMGALVKQRIRWASKTSKSKSNGAKLLGSVVFLANLSFIAALFNCFLYPMEASYCALLMLLKLLADTLILGTIAGFFRKARITPGFVSSNFTYPFMVVWVFLNSWTGHYEWKGRSFKK